MGRVSNGPAFHLIQDELLRKRVIKKYRFAFEIWYASRLGGFAYFSFLSFPNNPALNPPQA